MNTWLRNLRFYCRERLKLKEQIEKLQKMKKDFDAFRKKPFYSYHFLSFLLFSFRRLLVFEEKLLQERE